MTREEILVKLKEIMTFTLKNADELLQTVTEESDLYTDLGMTSVGMLYSVIAMEEMFKITFDENEDFRTVKDVVDYISARCGK